jgi:hypothetical protein
MLKLFNTEFVYLRIEYTMYIYMVIMHTCTCISKQYIHCDFLYLGSEVIASKRSDCLTTF